MTQPSKNILHAVICVLLSIVLCALSACGSSTARVPSTVALTVEGMGVSKTLTASDLNTLKQYQALYTAVNNWPSKKQYAAAGVSINSILSSLKVSPKTISFVSRDGYKVALTADQLTQTRYTFAGGTRTPVEPILAYQYATDATSLSALKPQKTLTLLFGQLTATEATNPAFVEDVTKIILSDQVETWPAPEIFPSAAIVSAGGTVKLTHPAEGLVKIYYTLDGTEPTLDSKLYNPSTYQPELNKPIPVTQDTTIKAIAYGYGKQTSTVATFSVKVR